MKHKKEQLKTLKEIQDLRKNLTGLLGNKKTIDPKGNHVSFEVRNNNHLLMQIRSLLHLCVFALDGDGMMLAPKNKNASKEDSITQVLELVLCILPDSQMYYMDKIDEVLSKLENS
ncbi:hypothetical protein J0656_03370 [Muricauda ruestringensis]|uniref:Uncharacterized protein n=1 Tax=Flagellimonas aurea TaxID=2915619 RepID=A0ABS3G0W9_9FLAO|nr:hypothetical protein [Allomuricauda aurea]MAO17371.1 hypothetical protein [Allomuricauda sp.]MBO0353043.1 hypothetical protein [Allomuricauda aurea]|tara:strand:- start:1127 stop:1474 length:348 start_codon:yes stop_codon:yes gene_type:complete